MDHNQMNFRTLKNYKYQLTENLVVNTGLAVEKEINTDFIHLTRIGILTIKKGYAWDGASGPTWDDNKNIIPSCVHDAFYQLLRDGKLDQSRRNEIDRLFYVLLLNYGMSKFRAWYYYKAVSIFGGNFSKK